MVSITPEGEGFTVIVSNAAIDLLSVGKTGSHTLCVCVCLISTAGQHLGISLCWLTLPPRWTHTVFLMAFLTDQDTFTEGAWRRATCLSVYTPSDSKKHRRWLPTSVCVWTAMLCACVWPVIPERRLPGWPVQSRPNTIWHGDYLRSSSVLVSAQTKQTNIQSHLRSAQGTSENATMGAGGYIKRPRRTRTQTGVWLNPFLWVTVHTEDRSPLGSERALLSGGHRRPPSSSRLTWVSYFYTGEGESLEPGWRRDLA